MRTGKRLMPPVAVFGFLLPNILGFLMFVLFPVFLSFFMAFTNWTVKPGVELEFLGLRNFTDLLGMQAMGTGQPMLYAAYASCAILLLVGIVSFIWANLRSWTGTKPGGCVLLVTGLATIAVASEQGSSHSFVLAGLLAAVCGLAVIFSEKGLWNFGVGIVPSLVVLISAVLLWVLGGSMWETYEPRDARFWKYLYNTAYLMLGIPVAVVGSLALALLLNERLPQGPKRSSLLRFGLCAVAGVVATMVIWSAGYPNAGLLCGALWIIAGLGLAFNIVSFRTIYYLPTFTAGVAIMILWKALYNPQTGPINVGLSYVTDVDIAELPKWLASYVWSKPSLIFMGIWTSIGGTNMLLYLAALSNVPQDLIDAAKVDGAGRWGMLRHVTIPQLAPTTFFIAIMSTIGGLQGGFERARVMTNGGPNGATTTLSYYLYNVAFRDLDLGYAAAISWVMFAIIFIVTAVNWQFGKELQVE